MRKALRISLLIAGCAVMLATSRVDDTGRRSAFVTLGAGEAQTFLLQSYTAKDTQLRPRLHVRFSDEWKDGKGARVVGIVSEGNGGPVQLAPGDTFTVGQEVSGGGRVAFVARVPFETLSGDGPAPAWELPEGDAFLTLYSPDRALLGELEVDTGAMEDDCRCHVLAGVSLQGNSFVPRTPGEGGDGG